MTGGHPIHARLILVLLTAAAAITAVTGAGAIDATAKAPFTVTSTLDGKTVLAHHIHWYANAPSVKIEKINFVIDGKDVVRSPDWRIPTAAQRERREPRR